MSLPTHTHKMLKVYFTEAELKDYSERMSTSVIEKQGLVDEKKTVVSEYTARINEKDATINRMASNIQNGYEHREVRCRIYYDTARRVKTFVREDSGEIVQEEVMSPDEYQQEIPGLEPIGDETFPSSDETIDPDDETNPSESETDQGDDETPAENEHDDVRPVFPNRGSNPDDFIAQMNAAKTASEGRNILRAYEDRLNQLQKAAGVDPVVGDLTPDSATAAEYAASYRGFSTLSKKEINAICKAVSKADPGIGMIHTAIVEQWPAIQKRWDELLIAEREQRETEN